MRESPQFTLNGSSNTTIMEKSKSLVVRTNSVGTAPDGHRATERGPELAEQLNEETKQKYVKGGSTIMHYYQLDLLIAHR